ncbi:OLC1v1000199C1 [Oldenlandia corymbosa var. corymbosa]|uniref:OLC1v1000199C1 n=1 Tax=Oldenlandia corymbosa var. corymbosa TaxID=529605 RepID=A0AAV1D2B2_OLDCO|nr:OLC1v1000199C1 [Oldenlandia corymbosa var. corymbosa]
MFQALLFDAQSKQIRSSSSNPVYFRSKMAHKIKDVLSSFEELYVQSNQIGLQAGQLVSSIPNEEQMRLSVFFVEDSKIVGREKDVLTVTQMLTAIDYKLQDLEVGMNETKALHVSLTS